MSEMHMMEKDRNLERLPGRKPRMGATPLQLQRAWLQDLSQVNVDNGRKRGTVTSVINVPGRHHILKPINQSVLGRNPEEGKTAGILKIGEVRPRTAENEVGAPDLLNPIEVDPQEALAQVVVVERQLQPLLHHEKGQESLPQGSLIVHHVPSIS